MFFYSAFAYYPTGEILHYYCCKHLTSPPSSEHTTPRHSPTPEDNLLQRYWRASTVTCSTRIYHAPLMWWDVTCHVHVLVIPQAFYVMSYQVSRAHVTYATCVSRDVLPSDLVSKIRHYWKFCEMNSLPLGRKIFIICVQMNLIQRRLCLSSGSNAIFSLLVWGKRRNFAKDISKKTVVFIFTSSVLNWYHLEY